MICSKCTNNIPDNSIFCNYCGKPTTPKPKSRRTRGNGLGSVYKERGSWVAELTTDVSVNPLTQKINKKKQRKYGFKTKKDALLYLQSLTEPLKHATLASIWSQVKPVAYKEICLSNQKKYDLAFSRLSVFHNNDIIDINPNALQSLIFSYSYYQGQAIKTVLSHIYKFALLNNIVKVDISSYLKLTKNHTNSQGINTVFTDIEIDRLWSFWNLNKDEIIGSMLVMIYTGLMPCEILSISASMIDYKSCVITGCNSIKTDLRQNTPIVFPDIISPVLHYLSAKNPDKIISCNRKWYYVQFKKAINLNGFNSLLSPYSCRKTTGTALALANIQPAVIAKIMRHTKYSTTLKYYTKIDLQNSKNAINLLKYPE